jgi:hypothetical protein
MGEAVGSSVRGLGRFGLDYWKPSEGRNLNTGLMMVGGGGGARLQPVSGWREM